jgi:hypothetical protein
MIAYWYLGGIAAATALGWLAVQCHLHDLAPVGLLPLGIGLLLSFTLTKLAAATGIGRRQQIVGAILFSFLVIFSEHTWLYRDFRRQWQEARAANPQVALFRPAEPWTPAEYFKHEASGARVTLWCVDAALIVVGTVGVMIMKRKPNETQFAVAGDAKEPLTSDL